VTPSPQWRHKVPDAPASPVGQYVSPRGHLAETGMIAVVLAAATALAPTLAIRPIAKDLDRITSIASTPAEPRRLYATTKTGRILYLVDGKVRGTFLNIEGRVGSQSSEQGLLSVAFHPNYRKNHRFYVDYTEYRGDTRVVEFRSRRGRGVTRTARQLLYVRQPAANHNGGDLQFDRGGLLYVGMGDGGEPGDPENRAQDVNQRLGKILRIDPLRRGAAWSVVALGLRNPWRYSFDRLTGDMYIADVGTDRWEEVDFRPRAQVAMLANYGWRLWEGHQTRFPDSPQGPGELVAPVHDYDHTGDNCSITGGYVYRGHAVAAARGRYFFGDYCSGRVWSLRMVSGQATDVRLEQFRASSLTTFGEDVRGELYLGTEDGRILKLVR
jgi:glucose/arabinose dehydrogenase